MQQKLIERFHKQRFMFEELVKRDFKQKYKRTVLGMGWSVLSPLLHLLVMKLVFTQFFGRDTPHYTTYLFAGNVVFSFFREATTGSIVALIANAHIFTKINVPKYLFLLSKNVSSLINFGITFVVFLLFAAIDGVTFTPRFLMLIYPLCCLVLFNLGMGLILSAMNVFFQDTAYLYEIFVLLLMYMSAIFYRVDAFSRTVQRLFLLNPVYCVIRYVRMIVLESTIPSLAYHLLILGYAAAALLIGGLIYKKKNHEFLYYV
ncbi:MAG: ABC transporter permease [Clostridiales bacterium]|nr:ABC transporter permease [Clostridiales bacterium]